MIEPEKSAELSEHLGISEENVFNFKENGCDEATLSNMDAVLQSNDHKAKVAIVFDKDGHYVQKKRPDFFANLVDMILNDQNKLNPIQDPVFKSKL